MVFPPFVSVVSLEITKLSARTGCANAKIEAKPKAVVIEKFAKILSNGPSPKRASKFYGGQIFLATTDKLFCSTSKK
ncbi:MAG: hypothetical protein ACJAXU_001762 [Paracoccaceae bacterium]|jgi:hypothetical protein